MSWYRIYFRSQKGAILGRDDFEAADDGAAMLMAAVLSEACSDVCESFELWQGARRLDTLFGKGQAAEITAKAQEQLIQHEESLRNSQWRIAQSKRLAERIRLLKMEDAPVRPPEPDRARRWRRPRNCARSQSR